MKTFRTFDVKQLVLSFLFLFAASSSGNYAALPSRDDKISAQELVSKHLDSIGTADARKAMKSVTIVGTSQAIFKGRGEGRAEGIVVLASQAEKSMIGMKFNNSDYPYEKMGYDGSSFTVGFVRPGQYSVLGQFLRVNEKTFKSGILGGTLSTAWNLLNYNESVGTLKSRGKTKIDSVELLRFDYNPKKGTDLDIVMFFDPTTFRHVRTEYKRVISGGQGLSVDSSSRQNETRYKMVEEFSGFKEENKLILPHKYALYLELITGNGTTSYTWNMDLNQYNFNQVLDADEFNFSN